MGLHQQANAIETASPCAESGAENCRCQCGSLVARIVADGVEIRCRRCKRDMLVPWSAREAWVPPQARPLTLGAD